MGHFSNFPKLRNRRGQVPLITATLCVSHGQKEIIEYLFTVTTDEEPSPFSGPDGASLLCSLINAKFYDIALIFFTRHPELVLEKTKNLKIWPLEAIANRPFAFPSGRKLNSWPRCINPFPSIKESDRRNLMEEAAATLVRVMIAQLKKVTVKQSQAIDFFENSSVLKTAIKYGTTEIVTECLSQFPDIMWIKTKNQTLIQIAIEERNEKILKLLCTTCADENDRTELLSRRDTDGNGLLHFAAKLASSAQLNLVSGAALQMQREMQWFKGVEKMLRKSDRLVRNKDGNTAQFVFTKEHKELRKEGELWMKDTSDKCMVVAALIATVVFAAAFTVPGGNISDNNNRNNGIPIFLNKTPFMVFAIADALALFSSVTSILMFLAILTSRYAEEDFLISLPTKLIIGLGTLFLSIAATMTAFGATLYIVLGHKIVWVLIPIILFACFPVTLFALLQFPLLVEMVRSTYWPRIFRS